MKKFILLLSLVSCVLGSCTKKNGENMEVVINENILHQYPFQFTNGSVNITIENDTDILTKSSTADYYTITGSEKDVNFSVIVENTSSENFLFQRHYSTNGEFLALFTYYNDSLVSVELNPELEYVETKGYFKEMNECIKSEYVQMRDKTAEEHPIQYDFLPKFVQVVSLVCAVVECSQKV